MRRSRRRAATTPAGRPTPGPCSTASSWNGSYEGLEEYGGFCDCEVVMNVDPDAIFEPVRQPRQYRGAV
jgi:Protein of unknown function (DUF2695)